MSDIVNGQFIKALKIDVDKRSMQDLQIIYYGLHNLEPLSSYRDSFLRALCKLVRYESHQANEILFFTGEFAKCWYILLSGAVFIGGSMFLPGSSFGKRNGGSCRRSSECFVLESSEMIVVEYPEVSSSLATNLISSSHFFQQQQKPLNNNIKNSICGSTTTTISSNKTQNIDGNSPSSPASSSSISATIPSPLAGAIGGIGITTNTVSNSINASCINNINAINKINKHQNTGIQQQQQLHSSNQKSYSQSPILSPASAGSLSISSVAGISLSPVSTCSKSNLILSGSSTPTNTSETNVNSSSFLVSNINLLKQQQQQQRQQQQQHQQHLSQFHHQQQQQQQQSSSQLLQQQQEKNQQKNQFLNTFSIPLNSGGVCLNLHSNTQQHHHRNSTPSILCTINNFGSGSGGINQSNTISSNINFKSVNMDPHHIRHSGLPGNRPELYQKCNRGSHSSDTSSAYSGSDTMTSVHSSSLDTDEVDLSGLVESVVDSDEEDLAESMDSLNVRDAVRDCLEKDPSERTEDDIEALLELTQGLKAFTNMTLAVRRALCSVMVFAVVDKAGTMVMSDGEELDSWSVLINGHVEIEHKNGEKEELHVGDSFGILPTMDKLYHRGVMRTKCDDCQFVCITQTDYYRIQHQGEENTKRHEDENGQVVMVTELRQIGPDTAGTSSRRGHVVIRGTINRLLVQLIEENSMTDPTYVEDFLLTHRTFIENPKDVAKQLLQWFENEDTSPLHTNATGMEIRDRVSRVILLWVNNHFTDFEMDPEMMEFLETFEMGLEQKQMPGQLRLLHIACAAKARTRNVTLTRSSRDEDLNFKIIGPTERGSYGIFVSHIERKTKAEDVGLKRGDQILEVNGQSFEHVTHGRAMEILMGSTHLSITVKSNLLAFKEMLQQSDTKSPRSRATHRNRICVSDLAKLNSNDPRQTAAAVARLSTHELLSTSVITGSGGGAIGDQVDYCQSPFRDLSSSGNNNSSCLTSNFVSNFLNNPSRKDSSNHSSSSASNKGGFMTLGPKRRIQKALIKMNLLPKNNSSNSGQQINNPGSNCDDEDSSLLGNINNSDSKGLINSGIGSGGSLPGSRSNNNSNNSSNKMNSANSNNTQISNTRNNISGNSSPSLYHSHSNPDLTSVASNATVANIGNNNDGNETNQNSQANSIANININNMSLNTCITAQQILTSQQQQQQSGTIYYEDTRQSDYPEHVLKVYKSDQTCKYLLINKETTAHEVVMLALQEFGIHETSSNFSLCEVSVSEGGMIKQRRLPEHLQNLAERIGLSARYYLKTNGITETLVPDDLAPDLVRESVVHLLQLNANEVAIQLTFQDFAIFRQIESTEYVDDLFEIKSRYGTPMLKQFSELVNREMFWVVTEVCSEHNMVRRMKIVKQFIKIARHCKECRNFNSMFAIISGLGHAAVSRLRQTWEKLPTKYQKLFNDLQDLMDPSRNMSKYRQLVSAELLAQHPIIPFYPVVKKDLTFIHLGNDTRVENLINFEKLRMIAKEVRLLTHMCSSTYDLLQMLEFKGQPPSSAMVALNQMSVSTGGSCAVNSSGNNSNSSSSTGVSGVIGGTMSGVSSLLYVAGGNATVKRRKKSAAAPNPKKMFEEAQMVRRVKAYLNNMKIITDEDVLHNLSLECEASTGGHGGGGSIGGNSAPNTTTTVRKRHPSPTLSTTSSTSSTSEGKKGSLGGASNVGPKFGTASPQAVKKILSLSESTKTRPHQPRHPGIQLPLVNVGSLHHPFSHSSISPSPSPGSHRRMGSCSSTSTAGSGNVTANNANNSIGIVSPAGTVLVSAARGIHERSHSDTPTPLPSVDLSAESSSVTSLSNLPLRKNIALAGSVTSNDSGHGSCAQAEIHSNCSDSSSSSGLYHVASSIIHNSPSPTLQQRRHSSTHAGLFICTPTATSPSPSSGSIDSGISGKPPPIPPQLHTLQHLSAQRSFSPSTIIDCNQIPITVTTITTTSPSLFSSISSNSTIGIPLITTPSLSTSVPISLLPNNLQLQQKQQQQPDQDLIFFQHQQQFRNHNNNNNRSIHANTNFHFHLSDNPTISLSSSSTPTVKLTFQQQQQKVIKDNQLKDKVVDFDINGDDNACGGDDDGSDGSFCGNNENVNNISGEFLINYYDKLTTTTTIKPTTILTTSSPIGTSSSEKIITVLSNPLMSTITSNVTSTVNSTMIPAGTKLTATTTTKTSSSPTPKNLIISHQQKQQIFCKQSYNINFNCRNNHIGVINNFQQQQQKIKNCNSPTIPTTNTNENINNADIDSISNINDNNLIGENINYNSINNCLNISDNIKKQTMQYQQQLQEKSQSLQRQNQHHSQLQHTTSNFIYTHEQNLQEHHHQQQQQLQYKQSPSLSSSNSIHTTTIRKIGHNIMAPPPPKGPRHPPAYSVAAQMARLHRLGRAHSHEGVTTAIQSGLLPPVGITTTSTGTITTTAAITATPAAANISSTGSIPSNILTTMQNGGNITQQLNSNNILPVTSGYYQHNSHHHNNIGDEDDDEDAQVSAV